MMADPNIHEEDPRCWAFGQQRVFRQQDGNLWTVQRSISEAAQRSGHDMLPLPASLARLLALSTPLTAVRSCIFHDGNHLASEEKKSCEEIGWWDMRSSTFRRPAAACIGSVGRFGAPTAVVFSCRRGHERMR
ncbi:hypothetical protein BHE74_00024413 [Ensete ventricosum]|nr:hypothetical protein BHE74_00024413 [Ensete ventricosum]